MAVVLGRAEQRDVAEWIDAVGTVTPLLGVTVQPQVDGRLLSVDFAEGQPVEQNQILARIDARPFVIARDSAKAALIRDRATLRNAELNATRYGQLRGRKMISEQQLTDQQASVAVSRATVLADESLLAQAQLQLDYAAIKAPVAGVAGLRRVDAGNVVRAASGNALVVINQVAPIAVVFALPQDLLPAMQRELQHGPLLVCTYGRDGRSLLGEGEVSLLDNQIDAGSGTIRLKAVLPNVDHALWPNQFVKVKLRLRMLPGRQVVPAAAVVERDGETYVFLERAGRAHKQAVEVALWQQSEAVLQGGLPADANLVLEGQQLLHQGAALRAVPPAKAVAEAAAKAKAEPAAAAAGPAL